MAARSDAQTLDTFAEVVAQMVEVQLEIGDEMEVKGPIGHVTYNGRGNFNIHSKDVKLNEVGLICGGTGITPAYQIIKAITKEAGMATFGAPEHVHCIRHPPSCSTLSFPPPRGEGGSEGKGCQKSVVHGLSGPG